MKHTVWFGLLLLASGQAASAQPADNLTDQQKTQIQAIRAKAREKAMAVKNDSSGMPR